MQHKKYLRMLISIFICMMLNACIYTGKSAKSVSKEQKADVFLQLGVRYLELNNVEEAKKNLELALDLDSNNDKAYNALGAVYERLKQYEIAGQYYQRALGINSSDASILNNYGRFLCEKGAYQEGVQYLKQALAIPLNKRKWFAYTNLGRCELKNGTKKLAEAHFRQALLVNPQYFPALAEMQKMSYQQRNYLSARAFLERYLSVAGHTPGTLWLAVQTERALGNKVLVRQYKEILYYSFPLSKEAEQLKIAEQNQRKR